MTRPASVNLTSDQLDALAVTRAYAGRAGLPEKFSGYGRSLAWLVTEQPLVYPSIRRYLENIERAVKVGRGLILAGGRGTGKTSTLALIAEAAHRTLTVHEEQQLIYHEIEKDIKKYRTVYILRSIQTQYERMTRLAPFLSRFTYGADAQREQDSRFNLLQTVPFLLIDELGLGEFRNDAESLFFEIIESRIEAALPTCFAMNGTIDELHSTANSTMLRLLDKLKPGSIYLQYAGESRRTTWGSSKDLEALEDDNRTWDQKIGD
jgi:DNA replication protein DnaC